MSEELPQFSGILGSVTAAVVAGVAAWRKWGPKPVEEKHEVTHDCTRKEDIDRICARLEAGAIRFERMATEIGRLQSDVSELARITRELEKSLANLLGRIG
jgi:predicted RNase H-like nuclease (RuvC/YqgF family)